MDVGCSKCGVNREKLIKIRKVKEKKYFNKIDNEIKSWIWDVFESTCAKYKSNSLH